MINGKRKLYYVIDNVITGVNHVTSNAGCINILQHLHPGHTHIKVWGEKKHTQALSGKVHSVPGNEVEYREISVVEPHLRPSFKLLLWISKIRSDIRLFRKILRSARDESPDLILFCSITAISLLIYLPFFKKHTNRKFLITLHGEIEYLFRSDLTYKEKLQKKLFARAFARMPDHVMYLVLSRNIYDKLEASGVIPAGRLVYIEHPLEAYTGERIQQRPLLLGHIGGATIKKNAQLIYELAASFRPEIEAGAVKFSILGTVYDMKKFRNPLVTTISDKGEMISQMHYESAVALTDYCLVFITGNDYLYRVSGATLDALQYHIPIIALRHDFVSNLFARGGDIGFICDNMEEMTLLVRKIIDKDPEVSARYLVQVANLKSLARQHYTEYNTGLLQKNLAGRNWVL